MVLATNIAETAITIDDVVCVVDAGRLKEKSYDAYTGVSTLQASGGEGEGRSTPRPKCLLCPHDDTPVLATVPSQPLSSTVSLHPFLLQAAWISKASERQRRGRAGRCQPGVAFHMYSRQRSEALAEFQAPEIKRSPLDEMCLQVGRPRRRVAHHWALPRRKGVAVLAWQNLHFGGREWGRPFFAV